MASWNCISHCFYNQNIFTTPGNKMYALSLIVWILDCRPTLSSICTLFTLSNKIAGLYPGLQNKIHNDVPSFILFNITFKKCLLWQHRPIAPDDSRQNLRVKGQISDHRVYLFRYGRQQMIIGNSSQHWPYWVTELHGTICLMLH